MVMKPPPSRPSAPQVHDLITALLGDDLHAKRILSLSNGVMGVLEGAVLGVRAIGQGLALARGLDPKHATKQVDRMLSNEGIDLDTVFPVWIAHLLEDRAKADVLLDWTDFDGDDHTTLMLSLRVDRGRSEPLIWRTVQKSALKGNRNRFEDELLEAFAKSAPEGVAFTVLADRGFADQALFSFLETLGFNYIIRLRSNITVHSKTGEARLAKDWVHRRGWATAIREAAVTQEATPVGCVVTVRDKSMQDPWILACSDQNIDARDAIKRYGKRFTCEELYRDVKDPRFGMGMRWGRVSRTDRRDRMWLLATLAVHLLTLLGEAGEDTGI